MLSQLRILVSASITLNDSFDALVRSYDGNEFALPNELSSRFGQDLWENYKQLANFVQDTETGRYSDNIFDAKLVKLINDVRHQAFLTFRRLSKLGLVRDNGPCPMCFQICCKDNPRATSHIIANAAYRVMISHFDSRMDGSMQVYDGDHPIKRMKGPSSVKWKMLCRKCEDFVAKSGECSLTELLKAVVPATNDKIDVEQARWRFTIAATLLWRTMHVVGDFEFNSKDVARMYPLYDELMLGMNQARAALARGEEISSVYPSVAFHVSPHQLEHGELDNAGTETGIFIHEQVGYVHVQVWTFHFFGFFDSHSRSELFSDEVIDRGDATWMIPAGAERKSPYLVLLQEERLMNSSAAKRSDPASDVNRDAHYKRDFTLDNDNLSTITNQPLLPPDEDFHELPVVMQEDGQIKFRIRYYPKVRLVHYIERFNGIDTYFRGGFNFVFGVTEDGEDFVTTNTAVHYVLLKNIDPKQLIRNWCKNVDVKILTSGVSGVKLG